MHVLLKVHDVRSAMNACNIIGPTAEKQRDGANCCLMNPVSERERNRDRHRQTERVGKGGKEKEREEGESAHDKAQLSLTN